jgi:N-acetylmuramoyl-L-alanine amidase
MSGFAPDHPGVSTRPSPNFGSRRNGLLPSMIVLHYTGMATGGAAEDWLCDPRSEVSAHYLVHEDGRIVQLVAERDRAWHAGKGSWRGLDDVNSGSIGIEIVNGGHYLGYPDFPDRQIASLVGLCAGIIRRWQIRPERVLAHSDVAPGRKIDPGEKFPWRVLHEAGIGHLVAPAPAGPAPIPLSATRMRKLTAMLARYGYGIAADGGADDRTRAVVEAFQRHFRPERVDGIADRSTFETLAALLADLENQGG